MILHADDWRWVLSAAASRLCHCHAAGDRVNACHPRVCRARWKCDRAVPSIRFCALQRMPCGPAICGSVQKRRKSCRMEAYARAHEPTESSRIANAATATVPTFTEDHVPPPSVVRQTSDGGAPNHICCLSVQQNSMTSQAPATPTGSLAKCVQVAPPFVV